MSGEGLILQLNPSSTIQTQRGGHRVEPVMKDKAALPRSFNRWYGNLVQRLDRRDDGGRHDHVRQSEAMA